MPRKMVPSTRKISSRGDQLTKVTRSASLDSRPSLRTRLSEAITKAMKGAAAMAVTIFSSVATSSISALPPVKVGRRIGQEDGHDGREMPADHGQRGIATPLPLDSR